MWRKGTERVVATRLLGIRSAVLLFIILSNWLIPDYDTSTALLDESEAVSSLDHFLLVALRPFSHWDAVYFTHVSKNITYPFEHMHAFFPALPILLWTLREYLCGPLLGLVEWVLQWPVGSILSERAMTLVLGVLVNQVASLKAAIELYRLTFLVYGQRTTLSTTHRMAFASAMIFCISPATIFFCAIYSEALYACFTFWGLRVLGELYVSRFQLDMQKTSCGREAFELLRSGILLAVTVGVRSTGFTYALFFGFYLLFRFPWARILTFKIPLPFTRFIVVCIVLAINGIMLLTPLLSYQYWAYRTFCVDNPNQALSPWCQDSLPNVYNYVQDRYWNVGLFRYYQVHQIPNFILASPTLILCCSGIAIFAYSWWSPRQRWSSYYVPEAIPFVLHWAFLTATSFAILHIQVVTRFMSATPPLYWFMAALVLSQKGPRSALWFHQPLLSFSVVAFSLAYLVVGSVLHTNFYPWT